MCRKIKNLILFKFNILCFFLSQNIEFLEVTYSLLNGEILVNNPYSQSEIAKLIGTSRPTFNIMMKELENDNYFSLQKGKIIFEK
ncbi:hypothetical protein B0A77_09785 [Flavobacterium branchiophilum]|uniref:HTH crp-type domain-containing protein n=1 Tax=Flavobacterium branchiophilum TaxID=55197 RepID=A0A2H3KLB3_9FLAO|nr:hypothetical protein B0A77_09785 [Flavobacterium branchiophilum]